MKPPSDPSVHLPALDGLRGIAVLIVLISHLANAGMLPAVLGQGFGRMGVALFYGLSGLLMARLYLHQPFTRASAREYAVRRGARVLPLYYACLLLGAVMLALGAGPYEQDGIVDIFWAATLVHGTGVLWSIPVELQFYVVFLGLWYFASRGQLGLALIFLLGFQAVILLVTVLNVGYGPRMSNTYNLLFWSHFFVFGTVLGVLSTKPRFMAFFGANSLLIKLVTLGLLSLIVLAPPGIREIIHVPRAPAFVDPLGISYMFALLVAALLNLGMMRVLSWSPVRWLGHVSFSVYLLHMPVIVLAELIIPDLAPALQAAIVIAVTFAASAFSAEWIEKGAQRAILKRTLRRPQAAPARS